MLYLERVLDAIILAIALSMDAIAISLACGAAGASRSTIFRMAWVFGAFHIAMICVGWLVGAVAAEWMEAWDHWIAFGLLGIIGGKMVWSALRPDEAVTTSEGWGVVLGLAVATSLDAVAAGITLPLIDLPELLVAILVGATVFTFVMLGGTLGSRLGARFGRALQVAGGAAIIAIGARVLVQHLS